MGSRPNMNMLDPVVQERIRRGSHEYVPGVGNHGSYQPKEYHRQEYPKVMDKTPAPMFAEFKGKQDAEAMFQQARREWDELTQASIVHNRAEEEAWLAAHGELPVEKPAKGKTKAA